MSKKLSTAAWIAHELGLASSFGGLLFGKLALNPNLDVLEDKAERGKLLNKAWNRYNVVNAASVGTAIVTWLAGRSAISGDLALDEEGNNLVRTKDALLATAAATGLASIISGLQLTHQAPNGATPIDSGVSPAPEMSEEAARLLRRVNVLGNVNIGVLGSVIAVSTILSMKANESLGWSLASRLLL
jgi:hypothetical protein